MSVTYEDFATEEDVAAFKRMVGLQQNLAHVMRETAALMVGGVLLPKSGKGKEFVRTQHGLYRLSVGDNADNTTEQAAHARMGAVPVVMGDEKQMGDWLVLHGRLSRIGAYADFLDRVRARVGA